MVFDIGRNIALNFLKPLKLINNYTVTLLKNPRLVYYLILLAVFIWAYWHSCSSSGYKILLMIVHTLFS